jgi:hypothetical protein
MERPRSIFGPLLLIAVGVVWLLIKSDRIPAANLWAVTYVWPYLLIAAGIGIILRPYWRFTSILFDVLVIGGVLLAIVNAPRLGWTNPSMIYAFGDNDFYVGPAEAGSGKVIMETRKVSKFDSIEINYPAQVFVSQGNTESVKIEADDNLLPGLKTEVHDSTLRIFYKSPDGKHVNPTRTVRITIVVHELKDVNFESAGELTIEGVEASELGVSISGAGNLELNDISAKELSVDLSGAGSMAASGTANDLSLVISGFGSFNGKDLHTQIANVSLSGAGSATVWADDSLDADVSGVGSVDYYGTADVSKQISGVGSVNHVGNR